MGAREESILFSVFLYYLNSLILFYPCFYLKGNQQEFSWQENMGRLLLCNRRFQRINQLSPVHFTIFENPTLASGSFPSSGAVAPIFPRAIGFVPSPYQRLSGEGMWKPRSLASGNTPLKDCTPSPTFVWLLATASAISLGSSSLINHLYVNLLFNIWFWDPRPLCFTFNL